MSQCPCIFIISSPYFIQISLDFTSCRFSVLGTHPESHMTVVVFPQALLGWQFLRLPLCLMTLRSTAQVFCWMSLIWDLSDIFLVITVGLWVLGGGPQSCEGLFFSHPVRGQWLPCWCWPWCPGWGVCQGFHCRCSPPLSRLFCLSKGHGPPPWWGHLHTLFGIFLSWSLVSSSFHYLLIHLFILVYLGYDPVLLYFLAELVLDLGPGSSVICLLCFFEIPVIVIVLLPSLPPSLPFFLS